jgi:hypothetical protein
MPSPLAEPTGLSDVARNFYDILSVTTLACDALAKIVTKYSDQLSPQYSDDMNVVIDALNFQHKESLRYALKLTILPLSKEAYNILRRGHPVPWEAGATPIRHEIEMKSGKRNASTMFAKERLNKSVSGISL